MKLAAAHALPRTSKESAVPRRSRVAVVLMAYGAADSLEEIPAYLKDILGGRAVPPELIASVTERYQAMGGKSPLKEITRRQGRALENRLKKRIPGRDIRVYCGMKHSRPRILEAVKRLRRAGCREVVSLPLTPYYSELSVGAYRKQLESAIAETGGRLKVRAVEGWYENPKLIGAFAEKIRAAQNLLPMMHRNETVLLLTAHSLPERVVKAGDPYPDQCKAAAAAVASEAQCDSWRFAYQSKGASGKEAWLGPDAGDVIKELAAAGCKSVLLSPIGFVSEHMETLYDDDVLYRGMAAKLGMRFERAEALNDSPAFIEVLADLVAARLGS